MVAPYKSKDLPGTPKPIPEWNDDPTKAVEQAEERAQRAPIRPRDAFNDFVASLPEDQRKRVSWMSSDLVGWYAAIVVDGYIVHDIFSEQDCNVNNMLASLQMTLYQQERAVEPFVQEDCPGELRHVENAEEAGRLGREAGERLKRMVPLTRTQRIVEWFAGNGRVEIRKDGLGYDALVDGSIACDWATEYDNDPPSGRSAACLIDIIEAALKKQQVGARNDTEDSSASDSCKALPRTQLTIEKFAGNPRVSFFQHPPDFEGDVFFEVAVDGRIVHSWWSCFDDFIQAGANTEIIDIVEAALKKQHVNAGNVIVTTETFAKAMQEVTDLKAQIKNLEDTNKQLYHDLANVQTALRNTPNEWRDLFLRKLAIASDNGTLEEAERHLDRMVETSDALRLEVEKSKLSVAAFQSNSEKLAARVAELEKSEQLLQGLKAAAQAIRKILG